MALPKSDTLTRLQELAPTLVTMTHPCEEAHVVEYKVEGGECFGIGLYKTPEVAVQRVDLAPGVNFPTHQHDELEWVIVYAGHVVLSTIDKEDRDLHAGDWFFVPAGTPHSCRAITASSVIGVTVPSSGGYPNAQ